MSKPAASDRFPGWLRATLAVQLVLALLFWLLAWDHTVSLAQGRSAAWADIAATALPLVAVLLLGTASVWLWRTGQRGPAILAGLVPWPLALVAFLFLGAI